jgi:hypothetical protein
LQRAVIKHLPKNQTLDFKEDICKIVNSEIIFLWNFDFLKSDLAKELNDTSIIDQHKLTNISETIEGIEFNIFEY